MDNQKNSAAAPSDVEHISTMMLEAIDAAIRVRDLKSEGTDYQGEEHANEVAAAENEALAQMSQVLQLIIKT